MFAMKPLHYAIVVSVLGLSSTVAHATLADCAINPTPAVYNTTTKIVTLPSADIPLLDVFTGKPTGEIAVFGLSLQQLGGVDDFKIVDNSLKFDKFLSTYDKNHALYEYNDSLFSNGGKLTLCVSLPQVVVVPINVQIPTPERRFEVVMRQLAIDPSVFHVESMTKADATGGGTGGGLPLTGCADPVIRAKAQTQLLEAFGLFSGIDDMVMVDYWSSGTWPTPLSNSVTVPTGTYTSTFVSGGTAGTYLDAIMKTQTASPQIVPEIAGKSLRFLFNTSTNVWSCSSDIPNGVPKSCLMLSTGKSLCDSPIL